MSVERMKPAHPAVTRAAEKKHRTGSLALSAPFCPRAFLLRVHRSGRWMVGAVGIEITVILQIDRVYAALQPIRLCQSLLSITVGISRQLVRGRKAFCYCV
jgi:hypothetical protein